jgi:Flp pilus assembly protein TadG
MSLIERQRNERSSNERGSISIMTAMSALLLMLMVGLTIDISRIYMIRDELQNAADAAALTAARELNGGTGGIDQAVNQAMNVIGNTQGLQTKTGVAIASVTFAANLNDDPYLGVTAAKGVASTIRFVKVTTASTSTTMLFASRALGGTVAQTGQAVAGMSVELGGVCDFYPAAVGLLNPNPTPGTLMTLKFAQGSGNTATIHDMDYIVLDVPCISGNGDQETARLAAGEPCSCNTIGGSIHMTPSSNFGNGGSAAGDGMNTRFGTYANGYGNSLVPSTFPSDTNTTEGITYTQYSNSSPTEGNDRRLVIAPIIAPGDYPADTDGRILGWGKFFLKNRMFVDNGNCANNPPCGYMTVEYIGKANIGSNGTVSCGSGVTTAVLYK